MQNGETLSPLSLELCAPTGWLAVLLAAAVASPQHAGSSEQKAVKEVLKGLLTTQYGAVRGPGIPIQPRHARHGKASGKGSRTDGLA